MRPVLTLSRIESICSAQIVALSRRRALPWAPWHRAQRAVNSGWTSSIQVGGGPA
ncbi:MAG: hypothetical protein H6730_29180 [Deltaproteobacteria bacterium]|nr:hypothetical protein [Deltaproteobacteria bacterium]